MPRPCAFRVKSARRLRRAVWIAGKLRMVNAGANSAESLNALLAVAEGEYVLPLAQGALLRPHALLDLALTLERAPSAELDLHR